VCPDCGARAEPDDVFCEVCGARLTEADETDAAASPAGCSARPAAAAVETAPISTHRIASHAQTEPPPDHAELDLMTAAAVSDRGRRHRINEDAFALAGRADRAVAVVCDGVSTTTRPERASAAAAQAAAAALEPALLADDWPDQEKATELLRRAVHVAQAAVAALPYAGPATFSPSTTLVVALVGSGRAHVASVGDSRAYWLTAVPERCRVLTTDDSWAEEAIAAGVPPEDAYADVQAHVITRWIGGDMGRVEPEVLHVTFGEPGLLVVCSDGLWNYYPTAAELAAAAGLDRGDRPPVAVCRALVGQALDSGGHDNVTVAVIPAHPVVRATEPGESGRE
jgi:serine/threonine protein phosphatase PrpC